jgi:hypothetical protein
MTDPTEKSFTPDELNRIWNHGLYEERLFHDRLNFFSLLEMGLLTIYGIMYNKEPAVGVFLPLTIVALLFTLLWLVVQARHWSYCEHITARSKRLVPEFKAAIDSFSEGSWSRSFSVSKILALSVPALFACIWIAFFIWILVRPATVTEPESVISLERLLLAFVIAALVWMFVKLRRLERLVREKN